MVLLDLLGRRWALRILYELRGGALAFSELESRCEQISPSVLTERLRELEEARILARGLDGRYELAEVAADLEGLLMDLNRWALRWAWNEHGYRPPRLANPSTGRHRG